MATADDLRKLLLFRKSMGKRGLGGGADRLLALDADGNILGTMRLTLAGKSGTSVVIVSELLVAAHLEYQIILIAFFKALYKFARSHDCTRVALKTSMALDKELPQFYLKKIAGREQFALDFALVARLHEQRPRDLFYRAFTRYSHHNIRVL